MVLEVFAFSIVAHAIEIPERGCQQIGMGQQIVVAVYVYELTFVPEGIGIVAKRADSVDALVRSEWVFAEGVGFCGPTPIPARKPPSSSRPRLMAGSCTEPRMVSRKIKSLTVGSAREHRGSVVRIDHIVVFILQIV